MEREITEPSDISKPERVKREIIEYFAGEKLGSGKLNALLDHCERIWLEHLWTKRIEELISVPNSDPSERLRIESSLRRVEMEQALLHHKIHNSVSNLPGYYESQKYIVGKGTELYSAYNSEVEAERKELGEESKINLTGEKNDLAWHDIRETLLKRNV